MSLNLNWINPEGFSFNCFLLMERFQIRQMLESVSWYNEKGNWQYNMGVALNANPAVRWYFEHKCPEYTNVVNEIISSAPALTDSNEIRRAEIYILASVEDWVIYTRPELMETNCDFIRGWNKKRLFEMANFSDKTVLDVGSGSGRLAFAAAEHAREVYASEPVDTLREYIRNKITQQGIENIRVSDGMANSLPYPNDTFDIVMCGHVEVEVLEYTRVCKSGGWLIDCPGDSLRDMKLDSDAIKYGFEPMYYKGSFGKDVYRYRKQVFKPN